jgi:hypothetical protein
MKDKDKEVFLNHLIVSVENFVYTLPENEREAFIWEIKNGLECISKQERYKIMEKVFRM